MKFKAVVFDMDGLLIDSESIALAVSIEACREYGYKLDISVYNRCIGANDALAREILTAGHGSDFPYDLISKLFEEKYYKEVLNKPVPLKTGVLDLLKYLEKERVKKAVATSTNHSLAVKELTNAKINRYFDFVLGGDQISKGKPNPEMYLTVCERLREKPGDCLALEDSDNGVISAFEAGLTVIQIPDLVEPSVKVKVLGHKVMQSLEEVLALLEYGV
jgi:HAD superfamily hydrolase (TIGR01509 family)